MRLARPVAALCLALTLGLHWGLLQSVAWIGMFVKYSRTAPVTFALQKTFDGQNPCSICHIVKKAQQDSKPLVLPDLSVKLELFLATALPLVFPPMPWLDPDLPAVPADAEVESPPTPPPRRA